MIHQNYITGLNKYNDDNKIKNFIGKNISEALSKSDVIDNYIYANQNWAINDIHGIYSCLLPSYLLNIDNIKDKDYSLSFPSDFNKTSIKRINSKNISKVSEYLHNMNIKDYVYINQLIRTLLENNKIDRCVNLFNGMGITFDNIEKILKVDKIKENKLNINTKQKKEFTRKINV